MFRKNLFQPLKSHSINSSKIKKKKKEKIKNLSSFLNFPSIIVGCIFSSFWLDRVLRLLCRLLLLNRCSYIRCLSCIGRGVLGL